VAYKQTSSTDQSLSLYNDLKHLIKQISTVLGENNFTQYKSELLRWKETIISLIEKHIVNNINEFKSQPHPTNNTLKKFLIIHQPLANIIQKIDECFAKLIGCISDEKNKHNNEDWNKTKNILMEEWEKIYILLLPTCKTLDELFNPMMLLNLRNINTNLYNDFGEIIQKINTILSFKIRSSDKHTIVHEGQSNYTHFRFFLYYLLCRKNLTMDKYQKIFIFFKNASFTAAERKDFEPYFKSFATKYIEFVAKNNHETPFMIITFYNLIGNIPACTQKEIDEMLVESCIKWHLTPKLNETNYIHALDKLIPEFFAQEPGKTLIKCSECFSKQTQITPGHEIFKPYFKPFTTEYIGFIAENSQKNPKIIIKFYQSIKNISTKSEFDEMLVKSCIQYYLSSKLNKTNYIYESDELISKFCTQEPYQTLIQHSKCLKKQLDITIKNQRKKNKELWSQKSFSPSNNLIKYYIVDISNILIQKPKNTMPLCFKINHIKPSDIQAYSNLIFVFSQNRKPVSKHIIEEHFDFTAAKNNSKKFFILCEKLADFMQKMDNYFIKLKNIYGENSLGYFRCETCEKSYRNLMSDKWIKIAQSHKETFKTLGQLFNPMALYILQVLNMQDLKLIGMKNKQTANDIILFEKECIDKNDLDIYKQHPCPPDFFSYVINEIGKIKNFHLFLQDTKMHYDCWKIFTFHLKNCKKLTIQHYQKLLLSLKKIFDDDIKPYQRTNLLKLIANEYIEHITRQRNPEITENFYVFLHKNMSLFRDEMINLELDLYPNFDFKLGLGLYLDRMLIEHCMQTHHNNNFDTLTNKLNTIISIKKSYNHIEKFCEPILHQTLKEQSKFFKEKLNEICEAQRKKINDYWQGDFSTPIDIDDEDDALLIISNNPKSDPICQYIPDCFTSDTINKDNMKAYYKLSQIIINIKNLSLETCKKMANFLHGKRFTVDNKDLIENYRKIEMKYVELMLVNNKHQDLKNLLNGEKERIQTTINGMHKLLTPNTHIYNKIIEQIPFMRSDSDFTKQTLDELQRLYKEFVKHDLVVNILSDHGTFGQKKKFTTSFMNTLFKTSLTSSPLAKNVVINIAKSECFLEDLSAKALNETEITEENIAIFNQYLKKINSYTSWTFADYQLFINYCGEKTISDDIKENSILQKYLIEICHSNLKCLMENLNDFALNSENITYINNFLKLVALVAKTWLSNNDEAIAQVVGCLQKLEVHKNGKAIGIMQQNLSCILNTLLPEIKAKNPSIAYLIEHFGSANDKHQYELVDSPNLIKLIHILKNALQGSFTEKTLSTLKPETIKDKNELTKLLKLFWIQRSKTFLCDDILDHFTKIYSVFLTTPATDAKKITSNLTQVAMTFLRTRLNLTSLIKKRQVPNVNEICNHLTFIFIYGNRQQTLEAQHLIFNQLCLIYYYAGTRESGNKNAKYRLWKFYKFVFKIYDVFSKIDSIQKNNKVNTTITPHLKMLGEFCQKNKKYFSNDKTNGHPGNFRRMCFARFKSQTKKTNLLNVAPEIFRIVFLIDIITNIRLQKPSQRNLAIPNDIDGNSVDKQKLQQRIYETCCIMLNNLRNQIYKDSHRTPDDLLAYILPKFTESDEDETTTLIKFNFKHNNNITKWIENLKEQIKTKYYRASGIYEVLANYQLENLTCQDYELRINFAILNHLFQDSPETTLQQFEQLILKIFKLPQNIFNSLFLQLKPPDRIICEHIKYKLSIGKKKCFGKSLSIKEFELLKKLLPENHIIIHMSDNIINYLTQFKKRTLKDRQKEQFNDYITICFECGAKTSKTFSMLQPLIHWLTMLIYFPQMNLKIKTDKWRTIKSYPEEVCNLITKATSVLLKRLESGKAPAFESCITLLQLPTICKKTVTTKLQTSSSDEQKDKNSSSLPEMIFNFIRHHCYPKNMELTILPVNKRASFFRKKAPIQLVNEQSLSLSFLNARYLNNFILQAITTKGPHITSELKPHYVKLRYDYAIAKFNQLFVCFSDKSEPIEMSDKLIDYILEYAEQLMPNPLLPKKSLDFLDKIIQEFIELTAIQKKNFLQKAWGNFGTYIIKPFTFASQSPSFKTCECLYSLINKLKQKQPNYFAKRLLSLDEAIYKLAERCDIIWCDIPQNKPKFVNHYKPVKKFLCDLFCSKLYINSLRNDSKYKDKYLDFEKRYNSKLQGKKNYRQNTLY